MKVTSERLPRSVMKLTVEMDEATVEKELDRAARSLSQKVRVPGFRPGKVPRPILERFYGRQALVEEASEGIINAGFRQALEQSGIEPVGQASLEDVQFVTAPYTFVIQVPVDPITRIADYSGFRQALEVPAISEVVLQRALDEARERHVVLREPEEVRAASQGDLVSAEVDALRDGVSINGREPGHAAPSTDLILEPGRLVEGLMEGVIGMAIGENRQISAFLPDNYANEEMRGAPVVFDVTLLHIQERILPDWEELPTLENFEGSLADFKIKTSDELAKNANTNSESRLINAFVDGLVAGAVYDYPDVAVEQEADRILSTQEAEYTRYGTTAEAVYKQMGQDRNELVNRLLPEGEERLKRNLAMREFVLAEGLTVSDEEIDAEIGAMLGDYSGDQRDAMLGLLRGQMLTSIANSVLDKKMRARIVEIATQGAGAVAATEAPATPKKRTTKKATDVADADAEANSAPKKKSTKKSE